MSSGRIYQKSNNVVQTQNIPEQLRAVDAWMGTRLEERADGKIDKPPYRISGGRAYKADKTKAANRCSLSEAVAALEAGAVDAIGFVFTGDDPFCVVDLDDAIDPETGEIGHKAAEVLARFGTYWEVSCSGTGLHAVLLGEKPGSRCRKGNIEIYDRSRFMVMTGNVLGNRKTVRNCQEELNELYAELFPQRKSKISAQAEVSHNLADEELLDRARRSLTGAKFRKLFDQGDTSGYESHSSADFALINTLIFWTGGDAERIERLFEQSALYRPKEKHRGYVSLSVRSCLERYTGTYYQPRAMREKPVDEQRDILTPYLAEILNIPKWKGPKASGAWKVYTFMVMQVTEQGIETGSGELSVGSDVRTIAEGAGVNRTTVSRSSLPYLIQTGRVKWRRGAGGRAGRFVLLPPKDSQSADIKGYTREYFNGCTWGNGLDVLRKLIRMRSGSSVKGASRRPGVVERVARLGMVAMFCMVALTATPRVQTLGEIAEALGRDKYRVRDALEKLIGAGIVEEVRQGAYNLTPGFWHAYDRELKRSLIVAAERRQRKQHQRERSENARKLKVGYSKWRAERDPKIVAIDSKRRRDLDREAKLNQPAADEHLTKQQKAWRGEEKMMRDYDRKVERCMDRLEKRGVG